MLVSNDGVISTVETISVINFAFTANSLTSKHRSVLIFAPSNRKKTVISNAILLKLHINLLIFYGLKKKFQE